MSDYQATYRGLTMGADTPYEIQSIRGLWNREVLLNAPDLPRYHGGLIGASYHAPRVIELQIEVEGDAESAELTTRRRALMTAFQPLVDSEDDFVFTFPGATPILIICRPVNVASSVDIDSEAGVARALIELHASDPAIYDNTLTQETLTPFTSAVGFSWPAVWPISWGAGGSGGGVTFTNSGDWESWPTFTISGPSSGTLTNPIIEDVTGGRRLALTANGGVAMSSGQTLVIESHPARRSIAFDTGASRRGKLSDDSDWFPLASGANELRFRASGVTTGASVLVEARSARI